MQVLAPFAAAGRRAAPARRQPTLYHDLATPEEALAIRAAVRRFADEHVAPMAGQTHQGPPDFPHALFRQMAEAGLFRVPFQVEFDGRGLTYPSTATVVMLEELAYYSSRVAAMVDMHGLLTGNALKHASPALQIRYLAPLLSGIKIGCFAAIEPNDGADRVGGKELPVVRFDGDRFVVAGCARFVLNASVADFVVLLCADEGQKTLLIVDLDAPGVRIDGADGRQGRRGRAMVDIAFDDVEVPVDQVVGQRGHGLKIAAQTLTVGRIGLAARGVGAAQAVFDRAAERLQQLQDAGRKDDTLLHWQHRTAERAMEIENARNLYIKAAVRLDRGFSFPEPEAAMARWCATNLARGVESDGVQIFGEDLAVREWVAGGDRYRAADFVRDCRIGEVYGKANEGPTQVISDPVSGRQVTGRA